MQRPPMWKFMQTLLLIQQKTENAVQKMVRNGSGRLQRKKYRELNQKLLFLCSTYNSQSKLCVFKKWLMTMTMCLRVCE